MSRTHILHKLTRSSVHHYAYNFDSMLILLVSLGTICLQLTKLESVEKCKK